MCLRMLCHTTRGMNRVRQSSRQGIHYRRIEVRKYHPSHESVMRRGYDVGAKVSGSSCPPLVYTGVPFVPLIGYVRSTNRLYDAFGQ